MGRIVLSARRNVDVAVGLNAIGGAQRVGASVLPKPTPRVLGFLDKRWTAVRTSSAPGIDNDRFRAEDVTALVRVDGR